MDLTRISGTNPNVSALSSLETTNEHQDVSRKNNRDHISYIQRQYGYNGGPDNAKSLGKAPEGYQEGLLPLDQQLSLQSSSLDSHNLRVRERLLRRE